MGKKSLIFVVLSFIIIPCFVHAQHYIIEDIPNYGDDGLRPEIVETVSGSSQIIEDTATNIVTAPQIVETTVTEKVIEHKTQFTSAGIIGVVSGLILAMTTTAIPLFTTTPTMIQDLIFLNFFGFLVKKKNETRWGVVFDIDTKLPILAAKITLFDSNMKELETTYSDKDGRFGFLATEGVYKLDVEKKNYDAFLELDNDELYGNLYTGEDIIISEGEILSTNIALKSTNINWSEYADKKNKQYFSTWSLVKKYLFRSFYFIGFTATGLITYFYPSVLNIILLLVNILFFIIIFFIKKKNHGTVMTDDKNPVPFAVVSLYDGNNEKDAFAVTDVIGRYYMLANNGDYNMKVTGQPIGGDKVEKSGDIHVRDRIVSEDLVF